MMASPTNVSEEDERFILATEITKVIFDRIASPGDIQKLGHNASSARPKLKMSMFLSLSQDFFVYNLTMSIMMS